MFGGWWRLVWPEIEVKSSQKFSRMAQKVATVVSTWKVMFFKRVPKVTRHLGYFWKKICQQELSKIVQSGHTDDDIRVGSRKQNINRWFEQRNLTSAATCNYCGGNNDVVDDDDGVVAPVPHHYYNVVNVAVTVSRFTAGVKLEGIEVFPETILELQCDQKSQLFVQYLAIYKSENLQNKLPK